MDSSLQPLPGVSWFDVSDPSSAELDELARRLGFHELQVEDCRHRPQRAKMEELSGAATSSSDDAGCCVFQSRKAPGLKIRFRRQPLAMCGTALALANGYRRMATCDGLHLIYRQARPKT